MGISKMIYFEDEVFNKATEGVEKGDVSKRINDLIRKGLRLEEKGDKLGFRELVLALVSYYNKSNPNNKLNVTL